MSKSQPDEQYSEAEAQRRFQDALKGGLKTPHKPLKEMPKLEKKGKKKLPKR